MPEDSKFSPTVRNELALRAGHRCSFPDCPATTIGPSSETNSSVSRTGMACHIYAARGEKPARRINTKLSADELRSIDNGIWMCYTHGKLIDTDEATYTPEILLFWRGLAEWRADLRQKHGVNVPIPLAFTVIDALPKIQFSFEQDSFQPEQIFDAFTGSCLSSIWGRELASLLREVVTELVRNAFSHGRATAVQISIDVDRVSLNDNGEIFSISQLVKHPNAHGGSYALSQLSHTFPGEVVIDHAVVEGRNCTTFGFVAELRDIKKFTPCVLEIDAELRDTAVSEADRFFIANPNCERVYVLTQKGFSYSDVHPLVERMANNDGRQIIIIGNEFSKSLVTYIREIFPGSTVIARQTGNISG